MADTITLLDNLLFTKQNTADVYTQDGDGVSAVKQFSYEIPGCSNVPGARVTFNGAYDPNGGRFHARVLATINNKIHSLHSPKPVKTLYTTALEWTTITPPAVVVSDEIDLSGAYSCTLHISVAQSSVTANTTGIEIIVEVRSATDEWTQLPSMNVLAAVAAVKSDVASESLAGQKVLNVTNPATGKLDHLGKLIFIEDTVAIEQCEVAFLVAQSGD